MSQTHTVCVISIIERRVQINGGENGGGSRGGGISGVIGCCMDVKLLACELDMHKSKSFVVERLDEARGHTNGGNNGGFTVTQSHMKRI